jgi:hypothetical protein
VYHIRGNKAQKTVFFLNQKGDKQRVITADKKDIPHLFGKDHSPFSWCFLKIFEEFLVNATAYFSVLC